MVDVFSKSSSLKDYLKKYTTKDDEEKRKKKRKVKKSKTVGEGVFIVDHDPIWQKPVKLEEEDSADEEKPQIDEDIDVKRMKRLELLKARRPFGAISEDGSGWVPVSENSKTVKTESQDSDISPPSNRKPRKDIPSPKPEQEPFDAKVAPDKRVRHDSPSPKPYSTASETNEITDLNPPRRQQRNKFVSSPEPRRKSTYSTIRDSDISPPRRSRHVSKFLDDSKASSAMDLSPPRKTNNDRVDSLDVSARKSRHNSDSLNFDLAAPASDLSPPRRLKESPLLINRPSTGIVSRTELKEDNDRKKKEDLLRFKEMDPSVSGRGAEPVHRDKTTGKRMTKEEYAASEKDKLKKEVKPKEIKLEWGKGLAQKREAEARLEELEMEKNKPFARNRDDPDLDRMLKERVRWGDPMAHLVTGKHSNPILADLGDSEKMKESGFIIPQEVPSHSWIRRGLDAAPNRYGIKPGRHWDGVDRSTGYEKELFKRSNERRASEQEAYLWSVSDM